MAELFENKKNFCLSYTILKKETLISIKGYSEEDAIKRFTKKLENQISGIYPYPEYQINWIRRIYKKPQF